MSTCEADLIVNHDAWYHDERIVWSTPASERPAGVLTLAEALDACRDGVNAQGDRVSLGVNIEIKNMVGDLGGPEVPYSMDVADGVLDLLQQRRERGVVDEVLISSFDPDTIDHVRTRGGPPTAQLVFDLNAWSDVVASTAGRGHVALHPWDPFVDASLVESAHLAGLALNSWTVDERDRSWRSPRWGWTASSPTCPLRHAVPFGAQGLTDRGPGGGTNRRSTCSWWLQRNDRTSPR